MEKIEMDVQTGAKRVAEAEKRLAELQWVPSQPGLLLEVQGNS
jgi:hypothetical protein